MLSSLANTESITSPYCLTGKQLEDELERIRKECDTFATTLQQLWLVDGPLFRFSNTLKRDGIEVSNTGCTAKGGVGLVLIDPELSLNKRYRVFFKIGRIGLGSVGLGVYSEKVATLSDFKLKGMSVVIQGIKQRHLCITTKVGGSKMGI